MAPQLFEVKPTRTSFTIEGVSTVVYDNEAVLIAPFILCEAQAYIRRLLPGCLPFLARMLDTSETRGCCH